MTAFFIDRRLNPKGKSLANRQRFLRRARAQIREAVQKSLKDSDVADAGKERKVRISNQGTREPRFRLDPGKGGKRDFVLPGNKHFVAGDQIKKPQQGQGGASGKDAATSGDMEDDFEFTMRAEEILDIFFEDLELPNLVRTTLSDAQMSTWKRAGITTSGAPSQINLRRTMRNSFGRRLALRRPTLDELKALEEQITVLESQEPALRDESLLASLKAELERVNQRRKWVAYIDPVDVRFNAFVEQPQPSSQAVMFCLMDVSGSMGEREKDLAKPARSCGAPTARWPSTGRISPPNALPSLPIFSLYSTNYSKNRRRVDRAAVHRAGMEFSVARSCPEGD